MFHEFDRRAVVRLGLLGAGAAVLPAGVLAQLLPARGFTHSVASGDPGHDNVLLWTRFVGGEYAVPLRAEVAEEPGFGRIVARAEGPAGPDTDWCARIRATGLTPGRWYFYRFIGPDGSTSAVGRTRTLPQGRLDRFNVAVFSCSNKAFGYFNAYGHAARRADLDLIIHVGDYLYEYKPGIYPAAGQEVGGRVPKPDHEIVALGDYRTRYADYRLDPDLQALHRNFPVISIWDDHEFTNDAWTGGAQNHQPDEGPWEARKAVARQAYQEWLPVAPRGYSRYDIGDLVSMQVLDTRIEGRDEQLSIGAALQDGKDGLLKLRDGAWRDPARTLLGSAQEKWVADNLKTSTAKWQLLAQQLVMANVSAPKQAAEWLGEKPPKPVLARVQASIAAASVGLPQNLDGWGGYMPARERLLAAAQAADASLVVVSGDSHNAWAGDLASGGKPAGVEFAGHSVSSPGFEGALVADPKIVAAGIVAANPELKWCDMSRRGYLTVAFSPAEARADWVFMATVREPSLATLPGQAAVARRGRNRMQLL